MSAEEGGAVIRPSVPVVTTLPALEKVVEAYLAVDEFVVDVETVGDHRVDPRRNSILWVGLAAQGRADIIPIGHPNGDLIEIRQALLGSGVKRIQEGKALRKHDVSKSDTKARKIFGPPPEQLTPGEVFEALRPVLFSDRRIIGANIKFDACSIAKYYGGELPPGPYGDVIIGDFLTDDTHQHQMGLAHICKRRLKYVMPKGVGAKIEDFSFDEVARYLHGDVRFTWLLWGLITADLDRLKLSKVMALEMDVLEVVMEMEQNGARIDVDALKTLRATLEEDIERATGDAYRAAGQPFNLNSAADKRRLLFTAEGRNLTPKVFTDKTGEPATSEAALKPHAKDPLVKALMEVAELKKITSTYITPYLGGEVERTSAGKTKTVQKESLLVNGKVHTSFKQHGARTGRFSSANPNLQQVPSRGKYGQTIRGVFVADPGHILVCADYSQIEPRVIASLSKDPVMLDAYRSGRDIYQTIADQLGVTRKAGKILILAMAYGVGPDKIASDLSISVQASKDLLDEFASGFPMVQEYKKAVINDARRRRPPHVRTLLGRRRLIPDLASSEYGLRARGERQAFNTKIQGSAADIMKLALVRAQRMLPRESSILLTVHDELVVQAPVSAKEETVASLREAMEDLRLQSILVPLKADIGTGPSWAMAKGE